MPEGPSLAYIAISPSRQFQIHGCISHNADSPDTTDYPNIKVRGETFVSCLIYRKPDQLTFEETKGIVQREAARRGHYIHFIEGPNAEGMFASIEKDMETGLNPRIRVYKHKEESA